MSWKLLDLFCGGGGAAMGYHQAGFEVTGVDIEKQPRYPFTFIQGDVLQIGQELCQYFDMIHASCPCQFASILTPVGYKCNHKNYIPWTREMLKESSKPYVIENVPGAKEHLVKPLMLCGTMFGLNIWRHRLFEIEPRIALPILACNHSRHPVLISGTSKLKINGKRAGEPLAEERRKAMRTPWMRIVDMDEAIPPVYTEWIGKQLIEVLNNEAVERQLTRKVGH